MKKPKEITVTMPNPCKKREWDDMTPNASGRHCSNCDFTVIDFTNYTDKELVDFLLKSKGKLCGMFENYQLNRPMTIAPEKTNTLLNRALLSAALLAGVATSVNGQTNAPQQMPMNSTLNSDIRQKNYVGAKPQEIKGVIINKRNKEPLEGIYIMIKGTIIETESDTDGTFSLTIPDSLSGKKIVLFIHGWAYRKQEVTLSASGIQFDLKIALLPRRRKIHPRSNKVTGCPSF